RSLGGIERNQSSVQHRNENLVLVYCNSPIHDAATGFRLNRGTIHLRIVSPEFLARPRIERIDDAPVGNAVKDAVGDKGGAFLITAARSDLVSPGQTQPADVGGIDLFERAVPG